jgi:hypothetical protein
VLLLDDDRDLAYGLCTELAAQGSDLEVAVGTADPARFADLPVATVRQDTATDEPARWRELADRVTTPFVVLADPLATPDALTDLAHGLLLDDADAVGFRRGGPAWRHVDEVVHTPIAVRRDHVLEHGWSTASGRRPAMREQLRAAGVLPYSLGDPGDRVPAVTA